MNEKLKKYCVDIKWKYYVCKKKKYLCKKYKHFQFSMIKEWKTFNEN